MSQSMPAVTHRSVQANGIDIHLAEAGDGPPVVLLHGFPELWYSWRHQLPDLAQAGYHVIAPDLRGYGRTSAPPAIEDYAMTHMAADVTGVLDALGHDHAVVAGHDWGANIAWACAQLHPDRITAVAALSVPFQPRPPAPPVQLLRRMAGEHFNWALYFQDPGLAEAELEQDVTRTLRLVFYALSGDAPRDLAPWLLGGLPAGSRLLDPIPEPSRPPAWLADHDLAYYAAEFGRTGFTGALNRYRNLDRDWADLGRAGTSVITQPALFVGGSRDTATRFVDRTPMEHAVAQLRTVIIPGCGHWIQQERPDEVTGELLTFLRQHVL
jgi:pimeloyl-ACP methyl ester carboxylesterase